MALPNPTLRCVPDWDPPPVGGVATGAKILDESGRTVALCAPGNPIGGASFDPPDAGLPVAVWSGWSELAASSALGSWGPDAWRRFGAWCDRTADGPSPIWIRPHAAHALCDPQRCLSFLRDRSGSRFRLILDPLGMLAGDMWDLAEEHAERAVSALGGHPDVAAVVVVEGGAFAAGLEQLVAAHVPAERPVLLATRAGRQRGELSLPQP